MRILIAEDERSYCRVLSAILEKASYTVDAVYDGTDALEYGRAGQYDGIILDIMLPGMDGIEVLKNLRAAGVTTPVMMLTAKTRMDDRITGYDAGADDYLPKPVHSHELLARVRALVRRRPTYVPDILTVGEIALNSANHSITGPKGSVSLTGKEYQMLELMARNRGSAISTEQFMKQIWCWEDAPEMNVVRVHMSTLRKKLAAASDRVVIQGMRSVGYSLEETV